MNQQQERDAFQARQEALRDTNGHRERPLSPEAAMRAYLAGFRYTQSHPQPTVDADEPGRPVDEAAPLVHPAPRR